MPLIDWDASFSVKIPSIDEQHKKLIDLTNELHAAMKAGKAKPILEDIIMRLVDYTNTHFAYEENLLGANGYSRLAQQRSMHAAFIKRVLEFRQGFITGKLGLSVEILDFLGDWLKDHIKGEDMLYSADMSAKGVQ